jgi:hypothetical protein
MNSDQSGVSRQATEAIAAAQGLLAQEGTTVAQLAESLARLTLLRRDLDALIEELAPALKERRL